MKTCQTFEDLRELGAEKIHERTHISRHKLELLLSKSFGELNRLQLMGFISILEREYLIDLSSLREEYDAFVQVHPEVALPKASVILQAESRARQRWIIGAILAIILLVGVGILMQGKFTTAPEDELMKLSTSEVEVPEENLSLSAEINVTESNNTVVPKEQNQTKPSVVPVEATVVNTVSIKPIFNVWVGMIDMNSSNKIEKITKDPIVLESGKDTLLVFGHGRLEINTPQGNKRMNEKNMVYFAYENGNLKSMTAAEFKAKNNGNSW